MKLIYLGTWDESGNWGHDLFVDDSGNGYLLTADYHHNGNPYRITDKEANALTKPLGVE